MGAGHFIAPKLSRRARDAWKQDIFQAFPYFDLVEWDLKSLSKLGTPTEADVDRVSHPALLSELGIQEAAVLYYTGGEHLFSYAGRNQDWDLLVRMAPVLAAVRSGKKVIVLPATFGPFETAFSAALAARMAEAVAALVVRDTGSRKVVGGLIGKVPPFGLDPAFFIDHASARSAPDAPTANLIMRLDKFGLRTGTVASTHRADELERDGYFASRSYRIHRELAASLVRSGVRVRIFVQSQADDAPARALIEDLSPSAANRVELLKPTSPEGFIDELGGGHITITSRFHGAIFSLLASRPAVALHFDDHGHKMPGLFEGLGMSDLCFNASHVEPQPIISACRKLIDEFSGKAEQIQSLLSVLRLDTIGYYWDHVPKVQQAPPLAQADSIKHPFRRSALPRWLRWR